MDIFWNQPLAQANLDPRLPLFASLCLLWELEEKERAPEINTVSEQSGVTWVVCVMLHYKAFSLTWLAAFMNTFCLHLTLYFIYI